MLYVDLRELFDIICGNEYEIAFHKQGGAPLDDMEHVMVRFINIDNVEGIIHIFIAPNGWQLG